MRHIVEGEIKLSKLKKLKVKNENDSVQVVTAEDLRHMLLAMTQEASIAMDTFTGICSFGKVVENVSI